MQQYQALLPMQATSSSSIVQTTDTGRVDKTDRTDGGGGSVYYALSPSSSSVIIIIFLCVVSCAALPFSRALVYVACIAHHTYLIKVHFLMNSSRVRFK